jgi:uncharacterized membrane protein
MNQTPEPPRVREEHRDEMRLNSLISRVLIVGLLTAIALLIVGVILTIARPGVPVPRTSSIAGIPAQIAALEPGGFFELGILVLLATPFARVVALGVAYGRRRQWLFTGISIVVLVMLILSAFLGLSLG